MRKLLQPCWPSTEEDLVPVFEICVDSVEGVTAARTTGADRVELCADLAEGGITPSLGMIQQAVAAAGPVRVHVLIRPRGGDFLYSRAELAVMVSDIEAARAAGARGVVIGALTPDGDIDKDVTATLVRAAAGLSVTFHRAFDLTRDPRHALAALIDLSVDRLLTSGQEATAPEGAELIAELQRRASGRIVIMPGGGVSESTVAELVRRTGVTELHFSASRPEASAVRFRNPRLSLSGARPPDENARPRTSTERIRAIMTAAGSATG
jgi:copper homeostasis protein